MESKLNKIEIKNLKTFIHYFKSRHEDVFQKVAVAHL